MLDLLPQASTYEDNMKQFASFQTVGAHINFDISNIIVCEFNLVFGFMFVDRAFLADIRPPHTCK